MTAASPASGEPAGTPAGESANTANTANTEQLSVRLRSRGYRLTAQRQLVLDAIAELGHATPEEVAARVRRTAVAVNISTVYRTLELLEGLGLVTHAHLGHGAPTYHTVSGDEHLHLVCRSCGGVTEVPPDIASGLAEQLQRSHGFAVDIAHFSVFGLCAACAAGAGAD